MDSISELIEKVGLFALAVAAVWVAILVVVSLVDRNPPRKPDDDSDAD